MRTDLLRVNSAFAPHTIDPIDSSSTPEAVSNASSALIEHDFEHNFSARRESIASMPRTAQPDPSDATSAPLAGESLRLSVATLELRADALKECCRTALAAGDWQQLARALEENIALQAALVRAIKGSH